MLAEVFCFENDCVWILPRWQTLPVIPEVCRRNVERVCIRSQFRQINGFLPSFPFIRGVQYRTETINPDPLFLGPYAIAGFHKLTQIWKFAKRFSSITRLQTQAASVRCRSHEPAVFFIDKGNIGQHAFSSFNYGPGRYPAAASIRRPGERECRFALCAVGD